MLDLYINIKKRRIALNMSQQELAETVGYKGKSMISQVENGQVDLPESMIIKFADALQTTPAALMGWEDFVDEVAAGQYEHEDIDQALEMLERYRSATPKVRSVVDLLLSSENPAALLENNRRDS